MSRDTLAAALKRLANELPTIAVGVWAALRVAGIDVDAELAANVTTTVESVVSVALMLLVRNSIDGPVTALTRRSRQVTADDLPHFVHDDREEHPDG